MKNFYFILTASLFLIFIEAIAQPLDMPGPPDRSLQLQQLEIKKQQLDARIQRLEIQRGTRAFPTNRYIDLNSQRRSLELEQMQILQNQKLDNQFQRQFQEQQRNQELLQQRMSQ